MLSLDTARSATTTATLWSPLLLQIYCYNTVKIIFSKSLTCITSLPGMESIYTFTQVLYLSSSYPNPKVLSYHYSTITVKYCNPNHATSLFTFAFFTTYQREIFNRHSMTLTPKKWKLQL